MTIPTSIQRSPRTASLRTNLILVDVDDAMVDVGVLTPYDEGQHRELERTHSEGYVFRRFGDGIEAVRIDADAAPIDLASQPRSARRLGKLLNLLVERGIERKVLSVGANISVVRRRPLTVVSLDPKNDVAEALFAKNARTRLPIHVRRGFRIEARQVLLKSGRRVAIVIDAITHTGLVGTCEDLLADGLDLRGLYVQILDPVDAKGSVSRPMTIGQVSHVSGSVVHLGSDRRDERSSFEAKTLLLDLGPAALARVVAHYLGPGAHERLWDEKNVLSTGSKRWDRISRFVERVSRGTFELAPGVRARLGDWISGEDLSQSQACLPRFMVGGGRRSESATGMFGAGPSHVPPKALGQIAACVVCERARRQEVETFLGALRDGFGSHKPLKQTWRMGDLAFSVFEAASSSASDYERACRAAIDVGTAWQVALVQVPSNTEDMLGDLNPYLVTKAKFLSRNIPVQEFRVETMEKPTSQRQWALGGIGLQLFAKLGGIPWLLETNAKNVHELVLGLGSANLGIGRFGDRERVLGLTTAFSGDGAYWLAETSRTVKFDEHEDAIIDSAVNAFRRVRRTMAWQSGDTVRVVHHSCKDFRGVHVEALKKAIHDEAANDFNLEFAFLHVAEKHPFLLFDPNGEQQIPRRGTVVRLGDSEALLAVLGPREVRSAQIGFPHPVCLKLHRASTYTNFEYLSEQALAFCAQSWRNFLPTSKPVTVLYAGLIADLLGRLGSVSRWDPDVLRGEVGMSRWFL